METSRAMVILLKDVLRKTPGAKILCEVLASRIVEDETRKAGGISLVSRTGHTFIQKMIISDGCAMAGEYSGHFFYKENYGYDDAVFASLRMAEAAARQPLSEQLKVVPEYFTSKDYRLSCPDDRKFKLVEEMKEKLKGRYEIIDLDGVKAVMNDGWFIARCSNTEPKIVVKWEATTRQGFDKIGKIVKDELAAFGLKLE